MMEAMNAGSVDYGGRDSPPVFAHLPALRLSMRG